MSSGARASSRSISSRRSLWSDSVSGWRQAGQRRRAMKRAQLISSGNDSRNSGRVKRALYAGDDTTDLDAFRCLTAAALEVVVRVAVVSPEAPPGLETDADIVVPGSANLQGRGVTR